MGTPRENAYDEDVAPAAALTKKWFAGNLKDLGKNLFWWNWHGSGLVGWNGSVSPAARIVGTDKAVNDIRSLLVAQDATLKNLVGALTAVNKGETLDPEKLYAGVKAAAEAGVRSAIGSITTNETAAAEEPKE